MPSMPSMCTAQGVATSNKILECYERNYTNYVAKLLVHYPRHAQAVLTISTYKEA